MYDYISGFLKVNEDGSSKVINGRLALFRNFDEYESPIPRPRTLLIDSEQLESGDALDKNFRNMAADEIDRFRRETEVFGHGAGVGEALGAGGPVGHHHTEHLVALFLVLCNLGFHVDQLGSILGYVAVRSHDHRDGLAHVAHGVDRRGAVRDG